MKTHGWGADMTTATIEAAKSKGMVKEKLHNGKLGLRLTESTVDQKLHNDTETCSDDFIDFRKFVCDELQSLGLGHCQRDMESRAETFQSTFYPNCISEWNKLDPEIRLAPSVSIFKKKLLSIIRPPCKICLWCL